MSHLLSVLTDMSNIYQDLANPIC